MKQPFHNRAIGYFDAVRRHGSIREAARRLDIAASAINRHILKLEADIGMPLFERLADGMTLTPAGEVLARHAIAVLQDERRATTELEALMGLRRGELSLVAVESLGTSFLPDLIERMANRYPGVEIKASLAGSNTIPEMVTRGEADIGLAFSLPHQPDLQQMAVGRFPVVAVMKPDHPLAGKARISFNDCLQYPLILPRPDISLFNLLEPLIRRHRGRFRVIAEVSSLVLMKHLTQRTGAISFQTRLGLEHELESGVLACVPLHAATPIISELGAYVRHGRSLPTAVNAFLALIGDALAKAGGEDTLEA
ncbi:MAG TPA: LysR family transcriptional regulator [Magnetospirillaceae bacterium]|nr:LysR family transcriptional regulator [Magnetospirillaceae bacterium]